LGFLDAIECDYDQAFRRISIQPDEFLGANQVMTADSRHCCVGCFIDNAGLESDYTGKGGRPIWVILSTLSALAA
jgi:hypothetical protein